MILRYAISVLLLSLAIHPADAAEISSNGNGGGPWSDPATWQGKKVPGPEDDAVILKGDAVDFDRDDDGKVTCRKLLIDRRGVFRLKTGLGKVTCCLNGLLESNGLVQLDGTRSANDMLELRFLAPDNAQRLLTLRNGAGLIARGRPDLPDDRRNVAITAPKTESQKNDPEAWIRSTEGGATIDLQKARLVNFSVAASELDNTGSRTNERLNLAECRLTGRTRLAFSNCDTPVVRKNIFETTKGQGLRAIHIMDCPLAEVRGNTIHGFDYGFAANNSADSTVAGNTFEKCKVGAHFHSGRNHSAYRNTFRDCECGIDIAHIQMMTVAENRIEGAKHAVQFGFSTAQITSLEVVQLAKNGVAITYDLLAPPTEVPLLLINTNVQPEQVKLGKVPPAAPKSPPLVVAMNYLIVGVKDAPANAVVEVRTVRPKLPSAPGAVDLNVRNGPAFLVKGLTPAPRPAGTPQAVLPLLVKAWSLDAAGKTVPAPEYEVRILQGEGGKLLKSVKAQPQTDWHRPLTLDLKPTLEVSLK